jgi:hypothetical protein
VVKLRRLRADGTRVLLRRLPAALGGAGLLLMLIVLLAAMRGDDGRTPPPGLGEPAGLVVLPDAPAPPASTSAAEAAPRSGAWRARELHRLRRSRSVAGALRRAWLTHRLDAVEYGGYRGTWARARTAARRLRGTRGVEQRAVVALVVGLARERRLTSSRLAVVFLTLRRNTNFWTRRGAPRPGQRFAFGHDPVVFRYQPAQGLNVHWLGTWGRANGRARFCLRRPRACPRARVRKELDRLVALASRRSGYAAYEGLYRFGGGRPGWVSGMVQGTAVQALARGRRAFDAPRFGLAARRALGAFEQSPPAGVAVRDGGGRHFLMYSFAPGLRILNGDLQAVAGLHEMAALTGSRRARRLFRSGERAARPAVARFDTGAWSLYSAGGREASLGYHRLVDGFLRDLCERTGRAAYCGAARRFSRYEREPTRIDLRGRTRTRLGRPAPIAFALSKRSRVLVEVRGARGVALRRVLDVTRGRHVVGWMPRRRGRYEVRIAAQGPSGPRGVRARAVRVTAPPRKRGRPPRGRRASDRGKGHRGVRTSSAGD